MAKKKALQGVTHDILRSFISRNNHVNGYWAIGKLYKSIKSERVEIITIDLLSKKMIPHIQDFDLMLERYREKLKVRMNQKRLQGQQLESALIEFTVDSSKTKRHRLFPGQKFKRYTCGLVITDSNGIEYADIKNGWCFPHHPNMENQTSIEEEE